MKLERYDSVYLSPHLDDVALSCPCTLLREVEAGARVLVATLFSHPGPADAGAFRRDDYAARWAEDARAMAVLGADFLHAGLLDAPFRCSLYHNFEGILFGRDPGDAATLEQAKAVVAEILERAKPQRVYAPLGVGEHIDHRLTHEAAPPGSLFYEDRPYAFVRDAVALRLAVLAAGPTPDLKAGFFESLLKGPMAAAFYGDPAQQQAVREGFMRLATSCPAVTRQASARVEPGDAALAETSAELYASQITAILGGRGRYAKAATTDGLYLERFWGFSGLPE
jgi:hypothetical protein